MARAGAQVEEFETNAANVLYERERLEWQVNELEKLAVKPGEWASQQRA
jgi:DNA repair protein RecN (Recombination protein N)